MVMMLVLVTLGALLLVRALLISATVRQRHWQSTMVAIGLLLTALVGYTIPIVTLPVPNPTLQTDATSQPSKVNSANLQTTLASLNQSGSQANPAYTTLLDDYTNYHAVLVVEGGIFTLMLIGLSIFVWRRFRRIPKTALGYWTFERKIYGYFGLVSSIIALGMLLIVTANLSNVINAQAGFAQSIPDLGRSASPHKVALHQAVNSWAQEGNTAIPALLQKEVHNRLMWQRPKAIVCSILLVVFTVFALQLWQKLMLDSRSREGRWSLKTQAQLMIGILIVPISGLVMIMALANTQASLAPITLTLLFS